MSKRCVSPFLAWTTCLVVSGVLAVPATAQALGQDSSRRQPPPTREQLREAVKLHRAAEQEQIQRDEALAGRRLTPAERAELREQLRQEWAQRPTAAPLPEPPPAATAQKTGWSWRDILPWGR
ncbi:hypothetical protein [Xenophilus sp. Marseille-Q4582]|uniref:hypothetical protein n=1 Tax=Xenophilus sp. Marseille-Q4582 TaxID=2866600 RepID=UPI001CE42748|nr:hypothetical protein [Xenophilus sp. Marseille-Q4582]